MAKFINYTPTRSCKASAIVALTSYEKDGKHRVAIELMVGGGKTATVYTDPFATREEADRVRLAIQNEIPESHE
jgi:hypothetical protein